MVLTEESNHVSTVSDNLTRKPNNSWFVSYLFSNISGGLTSPLIPLFVVLYLHSNVELVGITSSIASAATVPALIFWGNLSDRIGKRKIFILIGFIGSFASLLLILVVHTLGMYLATLIIYQVIAMASTPVATLLILENTMEKKWPDVMSSFNIVSYVGIVVGLATGTLILGAYAAEGASALPLLYLLSAIVYLVAGIAALILLPEPRRRLPRNSRSLNRVFSFRMVERNRFFPNAVIHNPNPGKKEGKKLSGRTKKYIVMTSYLMFAFQLFFVPFPVFVLDKLGGTETEVFIMYLANNIASAMAFRLSGRSVNNMGIPRTLFMALGSRIIIISTMAGMSFFFLGDSWLLWAAISVYGAMGFFWSFISVSWVTSISHLAIPENRGKAVGYYNSLLGVGQIFGALLSGIVAFDFGYSWDFLAALTAVVIGALVILRFQSEMREYIEPAENKPKPVST